MNRKFLNNITPYVVFFMLLTSCQRDEHIATTNSNSLNQSVASDSQTKFNVNAFQARKISSYTGEELFGSLFFGIGDIINEIPQLKSDFEYLSEYSIEEKTEITKKIDLLSNEIRKKDPSFFREFQNKILSGDQIAIQRGIEEGSVKIQENIEVILPGFTPILNKINTDLKTGRLDPSNTTAVNDYVNDFRNKEYDDLLKENIIVTEPTSLAIFIAAYFVIVAANTFAVSHAVGVAASVYYKVGLWGPSLSQFRETKPDKNKDIHKLIDPEKDRLRFEVLINEIADLRYYGNY